MSKFAPFGGSTFTLASSIGSTDNTILLSSFVEQTTGTLYTMALLNTDIVYGTIAPKTTSSEFISFTGITQNANGTALLTGVTRGLAKKYPFTTDTSYKLPHSGQTQFIISDAPQVFNKYVTLEDAETITGIKTFATGATPIITDAPTASTQAANKGYVDGVAIAGGADASTTVKGISKLSTAPVSATSPISVGDNDTRVPTQNENDALAGTSGTAPSASNKFVDSADTVGNGSVTRISYLGTFGSGSDGTYTLDGTQAAVANLFSKNSNTYTLLKDASFLNLTINNGITLITNGYTFSVSGVLTNAGTIHNNGTAGSGINGGIGGVGNTLTAGVTGSNGGIQGTYVGSAYGGGAGVDGVSKNPSIGSGGVAGGIGGTYSGGGTSGGAGVAGTSTAENLVVNKPITYIGATTLVSGSETSITNSYLMAYGATSLYPISSSAGSGGGGGGGSGSGNTNDRGGNGGGAGGAGGIVEITAQTIVNTGSILSNGGNGANGGDASTDGGGGGGGGGGSGGSVVLIYKTLTDSGTIAANGGTGGSYGAKVGAGSAIGTVGSNGLSGKVYKAKII